MNLPSFHHRSPVEGAYLLRVQLDMVPIVCPVWRGVYISPGGLISEGRGQWRRSYRDRWERLLLDQGALSLFQDHGIQWRLEPRGDARRAASRDVFSLVLTQDTICSFWWFTCLVKTVQGC